MTKSVIDELRSLDDLTGDSNKDALLDLPVSQMHPNKSQPRFIFDEKGMDELMRSIKESNGNKQPIVVYQESVGSYIIISGERRWRSHKALGYKTISAVVRTNTDVAKARLEALVDNIAREQLAPIEEAIAFQNMIDSARLNRKELALHVGKSDGYVKKRLAILAYCPPVIELAKSGRVGEYINLQALNALFKNNEVEFNSVVEILNNDPLVLVQEAIKLSKSIISETTDEEAKPDREKLNNISLPANYVASLLSRAKRYSKDNRITSDDPEFKKQLDKDMVQEGF